MKELPNDLKIVYTKFLEFIIKISQDNFFKYKCLLNISYPIL